jgi:hypothetical protein
MRETISTCVVEAVARAQGVDAIELPPLATVVDPDALDSLFRSRPDGSDRIGTRGFDGEVRFPYAGWEVTVRSETDIVVREQSSDAGPR